MDVMELVRLLRMGETAALRASARFEEYRLPDGPAARTALAEQIGADGRRLLTAIFETADLAWLLHVPAVTTLWRVWLQQFYAGDPISWRKSEDLPPSAVVVSSPYDPDARYSQKRETIWTGYKAHLTESCDEETPNMVTDVATTPATTVDHAVTGEGFGAAQFVIDWEQEQATCPQGKTSKIWKPTKDSGGHDTINIRFDYDDCRDCSARQQCVPSSRERALLIRPQPLYEALQEARARQKTDAFKARYAPRAGIEGTMSQGVGLGDLRRTRYRGLAKTRLLHLLIAMALNVLRVAAWLAERPRAHARCSAFAR